MSRECIVTTSWDDGYVTDLKVAELLEKYGMKGTFYIAPKSRGLSDTDIRSLDAEMEVGVHGLSHKNLTELEPIDAMYEVRQGRRELESIVGHGVSVFAYPNGATNEVVKHIVCAEGFRAARTGKANGLATPRDPWEWHPSMLLGNHSQLSSLTMCLRLSGNIVKGLQDWEERAKWLFDKALQRGGLYHVAGHSMGRDMRKIERVFAYISNHAGVRYVTNGEVFED